MPKTNHAVSDLLRNMAAKIASTAPDRLTTADGTASDESHKGSVPADSGVPLIKATLPADGSVLTTDRPATDPDRLTTADGTAGGDSHAGTVPADPGLEALRRTIPEDAPVRKSAAERLNGIRDAVRGANPAFASRVPASTPVTPAAAIKAAAAAATGDAGVPSQGDIDSVGGMSQDTLAKIACAILSTDEGIGYVRHNLEKQAGETAARDRISEAIEAAQIYSGIEQEKQAAVNDGFSKAASIYNSLVNVITEDEADEIMKVASYHIESLESLDHPLLKQAYAQGMDDAAAMEGGAEAAGAEGAPPEGGELPMGGENLSEEEVLALLQQLVESGEVTPEELEAALGGGGAPPEGAPPEGAVPPEAAAAAAPPEAALA